MGAIEVLPDPSMLSDFEESAGGSPCQILKIDLSAVDSKHALLNALRKGINLPDNLGSNWDALEECLRDLKEDNKGWLLVFENADCLLLLPRSELATFSSILADTFEFWKNEGLVFRAAFIGSTTLASALEMAGETNPSGNSAS